MNIRASILDFISGAWGLVFKRAIVVIALVILAGCVQSCGAAALSEHSSCQEFEQADASTQDQVLQDMMAAHHSKGSLTTTRFSVELYCKVHDPNSPIDGIYNSSKSGQQPVQAFPISAQLTAWAYSGQA